MIIRPKTIVEPIVETDDRGRDIVQRHGLDIFLAGKTVELHLTTGTPTSRPVCTRLSRDEALALATAIYQHYPLDALGGL